MVKVLMIGHIIGAGLDSFLFSSSGWVENIFYFKKKVGLRFFVL